MPNPAGKKSILKFNFNKIILYIIKLDYKSNIKIMNLIKKLFKQQIVFQTVRQWQAVFDFKFHFIINIQQVRSNCNPAQIFQAHRIRIMIFNQFVNIHSQISAAFLV